MSVRQRVRVYVEGGSVAVALTDDEKLTLEERLVQFDPARHGGEVMVVTLGETDPANSPLCV